MVLSRNENPVRKASTNAKVDQAQTVRRHVQRAGTTDVALEKSGVRGVVPLRQVGATIEKEDT
jgi:hypothetical protein